MFSLSLLLQQYSVTTISIALHRVIISNLEAILDTQEEVCRLYANAMLFYTRNSSIAGI